MSTEKRHSGLPTRAIHEAYLDMHSNLKAYREAKDQLDRPTKQRAHGEFQQAVLTLFELLRPHIRAESGVKEWWDGELPQYNGNGEPPEPEDGKAILQVQERNRPVDLAEENISTDNLETPQDWHKELNLNGNIRVVGVAGLGDQAFVTIHTYQKGLKHLNEWETQEVQYREHQEGFMSHKTKTVTDRRRINMEKLKRAARELSIVANRLGALSEFDASESRTEIPKELIEEADEWRKQNL